MTDPTGADPAGPATADPWGPAADLRSLGDLLPHLLTVADLLRLDVMRRGRPTIVCGERLDLRPVRWIHTSEIYEIGPLLKGGEVLLTTGLGLVGVGDRALADYITGLAERSVAALVLELGRTFSRLPDAMVAAARSTGLPLITLRGIVPFVEITETVHAMLVSSEVAELRLAAHVDSVVQSALVAGAGLAGLLADLAALADCPARLYATDGHLVAASDLPAAGPGGAARLAEPDPDVAPFAPVRLRAQEWGRLVICGEATTARQLVAQRGAGAIAVELSRGGGSGPSRRRAATLLLRDIFGRQYSSVDEITGRVAALGLAIRDGSPAVGICLGLDELPAGRPDPPPRAADGDRRSKRPASATGRDPVGAVADAAERVLGPCLVGELGDGILIAAAQPAGSIRATLAELADVIDAGQPTRRAQAVTSGPPASDVTALARSLRVAREASMLARRLHSDLRTLRHTDLGVHRLISRFATDAELAAFVEEQLGVLLDYDAAHGRELVRTIDTLLACGLSKAATARALHIRRQTLYQRLETIAALLGGIDLDNRERRTSLDLALVGWRLRTAGVAAP